MRAADASDPLLAFGPFVLDAAGARLLRQAQPVALSPKAFDVLAHLAARPGRLVTKDELLDAVWGHRHLSESVLKTVMSTLREALGDDARTPQWIETVSRRGYRFIGEVRPAEAPAGGGTTTAHASRGNLVAPSGALVGRADALAALQAMLGREALVCVVGAGGVGKTRLALAAADTVRADWPDGAWLVELATLEPQAPLPPLCRAVARALGLPPPAGEHEAALAQALAPLRALLLLDNAEHVADALAALALAVRAAAPGLTLLVTSQEPLRLAHEAVLRLPPLPLPAPGDEDAAEQHGAVQLFVQRVAQRLPGFRLTPRQRAAAAGICRCVDGLPLAVELAAASVPLLGVHGLHERLQADAGDAPAARLDLPGQGWRDAAPRQRSLREAIAWSHALLTPPQQRLFRRLAVFRGGFTPAAAEQVCGDDGDAAAGVLPALAALVELSLVEATPGGRCRLLEAPRAFAAEQLHASGERAALQQRHAAWMARYWAAESQRRGRTPLHLQIEAARPELDNLRAAMATGLHGAGQRTDAAALLLDTFTVLYNDGLAAEVRQWHDLLCDDPLVLARPALRAGLALVRAYLALLAGTWPPEACGDALAAAIAQYAAAGDRARESLALYLWWMLGHGGLPGVDRPATLARLRALETPQDSPLATRRRRLLEQLALREAGRTEDYRQACRDELVLLRGLGARIECLSAAQALLLAELDAAQVPAALAVAHDAVADAEALGQERNHPALLALHGLLLAEHGPLAQARQALRRHAGALQGAGRLWMAGTALAWLAAREERDAVAASLVGWAQAQARRRGQGQGAAAARSQSALRTRLAARLGPQAMADAEAGGAELTDAPALALAWAGDKPAP